MDEEEQQQSDSKISVSSFFERVDSVDKVANRALSKANANFDIVNNQKTLINSINISIEALETKVRDIANYIIIEKKIEKDAEEDRLFEQQDESQKGSMLERLAGLKSNNESEQTQAAGEEPKKGGGGILGTLLSLGIGAFALKFLWPAILPAVGGLLKGALAKFAMFSIGGIGSLIKGMLVGSGLTKIGFLGIGASLLKLGQGTEDTFNNAGESAAKKIEGFKFNEKGEVSGGDGKLSVDGGTEGGEEKEMSNLGPDYKKQEEDAFKAAEDFKVEKSNLNLEENSAVNDMDETLEKKDLKKKKFKVTKEKRSMTKEEKRKFFENMIESGEKGLLRTKNAKKIEFHKRKIHRGKIGLRDMGDERYESYDRNVTEKERIKGVEELVKSGVVTPGKYTESATIEKTIVEPVTENKDLDLSLSDSFSDKLQPLNEQIDTLSEFTTGSTNTFEESQLVARPVNNPNTTVTLLKSTSSNTPFTNLMSNKHLSLNKTQKAELLRYIK